MANARLYGFWGSLTEGAAHRRAAERGEDAAATSSRRSTPTPTACAQFLQGDDRRSASGAAHGDRRDVPVGALPDASSTSAAPRAACRSSSRWRTTHLTRRRLRPARRSSRSSTSTSRASGSSDRLELPAAATSSPTRCPQADVLVMGHILHDWDLDEKRALLAEGVRRAARRRRADRLRGDHRRRPARERLRAADEPEHADRDARRLRLHRRRLPRLDARGGLQRDATSSTSSGPTRWSSGSSKSGLMRKGGRTRFRPAPGRERAGRKTARPAQSVRSASSPYENTSWQGLKSVSADPGNRAARALDPLAVTLVRHTELARVLVTGEALLDGEVNDQAAL